MALALSQVSHNSLVSLPAEIGLLLGLKALEAEVRNLLGLYLCSERRGSAHSVIDLVSSGWYAMFAYTCYPRMHKPGQLPGEPTCRNFGVHQVGGS